VIYLIRSKGKDPKIWKIGHMTQATPT